MGSRNKFTNFAWTKGYHHYVKLLSLFIYNLKLVYSKNTLNLVHNLKVICVNSYVVIFHVIGGLETTRFIIGRKWKIGFKDFQECTPPQIKVVWHGSSFIKHCGRFLTWPTCIWIAMDTLARSQNERNTIQFWSLSQLACARFIKLHQPKSTTYIYWKIDYSLTLGFI